MPYPRIAPKRKLVQWFFTLLIIGLPFARIGGESLLRMDAATLSLLFFGAKLRIEEFYLFLIVALILVFGFLFVTMVFGRVWCGWFCPQTIISDLVEFIDDKTNAIITWKLPAWAVKQCSYLVIAFLASANLVWYFIPPKAFMQRLITGEIGMVAGITLAAGCLLLYLDLVLVRRDFCRTVCPYGRIQLMTMDRNTLTLEFDPALLDVCISCGSCERVCPMAIDIKDGLQIECINCGRCLDACRAVMAKLGRNGLILYTFGARAEGGGQPLNRRSLLLAGVVVLLCLVLTAGIATRKEATLKIQRTSNIETRTIAENAVINGFSGYIENRSASPAEYGISPVQMAGYRIELLGSVTDVSLPANANRRIDFIVKISPVPETSLQLKLNLVANGKIIAATPVTFLAK